MASTPFIVALALHQLLELEEEEIQRRRAYRRRLLMLAAYWHLSNVEDNVCLNNGDILAVDDMDPDEHAVGACAAETASGSAWRDNLAQGKHSHVDSLDPPFHPVPYPF